MVVVNSLEEARAALARGVDDMESAPFAACYAGVNYYHAMLQQLRREFPGRDFVFALCCGHDAAIAHDALRLGFTRIICDCSDGHFKELATTAQNAHATLLRRN